MKTKEKQQSIGQTERRAGWGKDKGGARAAPGRGRHAHSGDQAHSRAGRCARRGRAEPHGEAQTRDSAKEDAAPSGEVPCVCLGEGAGAEGAVSAKDGEAGAINGARCARGVGKWESSAQ